MKVKIYKLGVNWQFQLIAGNGEALLTSELYSSREACIKAINIVLNTPITKEIIEAKKGNKEDL